MNSSRSGCSHVFAIENERCSPSPPGIATSMYCPALKTTLPGSRSRSTSRRMSWVSVSMASTSVVAVTIGTPLRNTSSS